MDARALLAVAAGAALGGALRFAIATLVVGRLGPALAYVATFGINVAGSYAIGVVLGFAQERPGFDPLLRVFLTVGVLGGFTTFSSFAYETLRLATAALTLTAVAYVCASVGLGLGGAWLGVATARALAR